jgi:hypothetical protein
MQFLPNTNHQSLDTIEFNTYKINSTDYINSKLNSLGYMVRSLRSELGLKIPKRCLFLLRSLSVKLWYHVLGYFPT